MILGPVINLSVFGVGTIGVGVEGLPLGPRVCDFDRLKCQWPTERKDR